MTLAITAVGHADARPVSRSRIIAACTIGNALEFFDFVIFSFFARTIGQLFFPSQDPTAQLLLAFATYGVGFLMRPLGGVVLGAYADRKGRKKATVLTLMLMALGTAMIGLPRSMPRRAPSVRSSSCWGASSKASLPAERWAPRRLCSPSMLPRTSAASMARGSWRAKALRSSPLLEPLSQ